ncbi:MAG: hypothetical protein NKF70_00295 [Methanobacterium sp. ERen5]|nr:MAG: hypothetical protein NKF70_00295 [Methanobacterium sp. ERen5]
MDTKLVNKLRLYTVIMVVMVAIVIYEVLISKFSPELAVVGFISGIVVGIFVARIYKLSWDESNNNVTGTVDVIGGIILVLYFTYIFTRTYYLGQWVSGIPLFAFILSMTAGTMFGRIINTRHDVLKILRALKLM